MKKKLILLFVAFLLLSCEKNDENYTLCDSENILCKYFEIKYDNIAEITEDNAELSVEDINTYNNLSEQNLNDKDNSTIFDIYTGIFIPRFSYSIKDAQSIEKLWFGLALYPGDKKNDFKNLTDLYYSNDNYSFQSKGVYGDCNKDENSYLDSKISTIYNCRNNELASYDFWVSDKDYMWRMICVWDKDKFEGVNQRKLLVKDISSSDTCRESFKSFKSKLE